MPLAKSHMDGHNSIQFNSSTVLPLPLPVLIQLFHSPLEFVRVLPGEPVPER